MVKRSRMRKVGMIPVGLFRKVKGFYKADWDVLKLTASQHRKYSKLRKSGLSHSKALKSVKGKR